MHYPERVCQLEYPSATPTSIIWPLIYIDRPWGSRIVDAREQEASQPAIQPLVERGNIHYLSVLGGR